MTLTSNHDMNIKGAGFHATDMTDALCTRNKLS